jgi:mercuric ion binding protein
MKNSILKLLLFSFLLTTFACKEKNNENTTQVNARAEFKVWGNCEMCKETIEQAVNVEGVSKAEWNTETKQIAVSYDSTKISLDQIQKNVAAAGYDNEKYKGNETVYHNLPECCQYERK